MTTVMKKFQIPTTVALYGVVLNFNYARIGLQDWAGRCERFSLSAFCGVGGAKWGEGRGEVLRFHTWLLSNLALIDSSRPLGAALVTRLAPE